MGWVIQLHMVTCAAGAVASFCYGGRIGGYFGSVPLARKSICRPDKAVKTFYSSMVLTRQGRRAASCEHC